MTISYGATEPPLSKSKRRNQLTVKFSTTKHYSLQYPDKALFTLQYPWQNFQRMRLLSANAKCNYQMTTTSYPDRKHLLLQISKLNNASQVYLRRYKSKQKAELVRVKIRQQISEFSLVFILSFSLIKSVLSISANFPFQILNKIIRVSLQTFLFQ